MIAAGIAVMIMAAFVPLNLWLLDAVKRVPSVNMESANRNFIATIINQSLQIVNMALSVVVLWVVVKLLNAAPVYESKEAFKDTHPTVPDHYLEDNRHDEQDKVK
jgi:hypothetical protein